MDRDAQWERRREGEKREDVETQDSSEFLLLYSAHTGLCFCASVQNIPCPCSLVVYISALPLLTPHLRIHHLHHNCVHAVCTSNALPCCFWWRPAPSHTPSMKYTFLFACLSLRLDEVDVVYFVMFIVETLHSVCLMFCLSYTLRRVDGFFFLLRLKITAVMYLNVQYVGFQLRTNVGSVCLCKPQICSKLLHFFMLQHYICYNSVFNFMSWQCCAHDLDWFRHKKQVARERKRSCFKIPAFLDVFSKWSVLCCNKTQLEIVLRSAYIWCQAGKCWKQSLMLFDCSSNISKWPSGCIRSD